MAGENEDTRSVEERLDALNRLVKQQQKTIEEFQERENQRNLQSEQNAQSTPNTSNTGNNSVGTVEVDVRRLLLQSSQPTIVHYALPIKSGDPEKWINWYESATNEIGWSDQKRIYNMAVYLEEQASKWLNNNKQTEWPNIKQAFITHFRAQQGERSEFDALKFIPRGNMIRFVEMKEEKANIAGIPEEEAVQQTVLHGRLPTVFAVHLSDNLPKTFNELKNRLNRMATVQQQQDNHYVRQDQQDRPFYRPMDKFRQSFRKTPYPNSRPNNQQSLRPTTPCPICKSRSIISYHWKSECRNAPENNRTTGYRNQAQQSKNKTVKTFEHQPQNDIQDNSGQAPN